jgi:hypothetical protein
LLFWPIGAWCDRLCIPVFREGTNAVNVCSIEIVEFSQMHYQNSLWDALYCAAIRWQNYYWRNRKCGLTPGACRNQGFTSKTYRVI